MSMDNERHRMRTAAREVPRTLIRPKLVSHGTDSTKDELAPATQQGERHLATTVQDPAKRLGNGESVAFQCSHGMV